MNIADLGSMLDGIRGFAASNIKADKLASLNSLGNAVDRLTGLGLMELHLGSEGASMQIGMGGINVAKDLNSLGKGVATKLALAAYKNNQSNILGKVMDKSYGYGDRRMKTRYGAFLRARTGCTRALTTPQANSTVPRRLRPSPTAAAAGTFI